MTKELLAEIADAQMVLVGIGKEMEETYKEMENDSFYSSLMAQAEKEEDAAAILQYLQCYYREKNPDSGKIDAYNRLADLLEEKIILWYLFVRMIIFIRQSWMPAVLLPPAVVSGRFSAIRNAVRIRSRLSGINR